MSQWAKNFTRLGRDGYNLARAVVQHRGSNVKPILLDHARQSNSVATSLLHVDKEVGLVRYYGLSGYLKQRFQSTSSLPVPAVATGEDDSRGDGGKTGKIAFMVTASMKQELSERLGYDAEKIKTMTPLQASLILNESIEPNEMATKLPMAEAEYELQRQKEEAEARERAEQLQQDLLTVDRQPAASMAKVDFGVTQFFGVGEGYMSRDELPDRQNSNIGEFFSGSEWFEVTETNAAGETSRVGLYLDKNEAELGLKTRRDIAEAKKTSLTFDIHRMDVKDLK